MADGQEEQVFGVLLRQYRLAAGLTQEALAERAGLGTRSIQHLERGESQPQRETAQRLATALALADAQRARFEALAQPVPRRRLAVTAASAPGVAEVAPRDSAHNLPLQLTSFIGREREVAEVSRLLGSTRLLTLTGAGGSGKTRLALAVAAGLVGQYGQGVWLVELAPLADPTLVIQVVVQSLGLREAEDQPLLGTLIGHLKERQALLVLDNCEHLVGACAELATELLRGCLRLRILATSREGLGVAGERLYRVPSLPAPPLDRVPALEELGSYGAVALFLTRAQDRWSAFALTAQNAQAVAQVCARLDGLPLAIELAAAWVAVLPVEGIAARLDDRFRLLAGGPRTALPRQRTLRATLDWSYDLLSAPEQLLVQRLAVFAGGWTLDAAEAICSGEGLEGWVVLDVLAGLVNKSLVLWNEASRNALSGRYRLLETVRQYARLRLEERGEIARLRQAHARYYLALAEQGEPAMWGGPEQGVWLARLTAEHDNMRAVLAWAEEADEAHLRLQLTSALGRYWFIQGQASEGRGQLERALAANPQADPFLRARALTGLGALVTSQGEPARAVACFEEGLALFRTLGDARWIAFTHFAMGNAWRDRGDWRRAKELYEASLALSQHRGGDWGFVRGLPLVMLGWLLLDMGEQRRGVSLLEEALALGRGLGDQVVIGTALLGLSWAAHYAGDDPRALALGEEALTVFRMLGHHLGILDALATLGWVSLQQEDSERSAMLFREGLRIAHERGGRGRAADCLGGLGAVAGRWGQVRQAAALFGAAARLREAAGTPHYPSNAAYERALAAAREQLDDAAWVAAWAEGQAMTTEQATASALAAARAPTAPPQGPAPARSPLATPAAPVPRLDAQVEAEQSEHKGAVVAPSARRLSRTERQAWALAHLRAAGPLSPQAYASALAVSVDTASSDLRGLLAHGLVRAEGTTKDRRYILRVDDA